MTTKQTFSNRLRTVGAAGGILVTLAAFGGSGCTVGVRPGVVYVDEDPPAPRYIQAEVRPGFFFVQGRWERRGNQWAWREGYYERERPGNIWIEGRWERQGNHRVWRDGRWEVRAGGPVIRDHR